MQTRHNCFQEYNKRGSLKVLGKLRWSGNFTPEAAQTQNRKSLCVYSVPLLCVCVCVCVKSPIVFASSQSYQPNSEVPTESQRKLNNYKQALY